MEGNLYLIHLFSHITVEFKPLNLLCVDLTYKPGSLSFSHWCFSCNISNKKRLVLFLLKFLFGFFLPVFIVRMSFHCHSMVKEELLYLIYLTLLHWTSNNYLNKTHLRCLQGNLSFVKLLTTHTHVKHDMGPLVETGFVEGPKGWEPLV